MDLLPTPEQQQIVDAAKTFLAREYPLGDALNGGGDAARAGSIALRAVAELGWLGIGLAESSGGVGYGLPEEALLFVELGRQLMPPCLLGAALGARVAAAAGAEDLCHAILAGERKVALGTPRSFAASVKATVSGEFLAFDTGDAELLLLTDDSGAALLEAGALELADADCIDPLLRASTLSCHASDTAAFVRAEAEPVFARGALLTGAMLLGIAEAVTDRAVAYAQEREQFGRPIGSFQAIKHNCADMAVRCECVRAMLYHASINAESLAAAAGFDLHCLKALAITAATLNAGTAVQIHGGMGYTEEMDIHLFVKRAQLLSPLFGGERYHLNKLLAEQRAD
tara:strand:- start:63 stop:1088 length:1026 start_codon:yes stop_codon:yes gene_type:complete